MHVEAINFLFTAGGVLRCFTMQKIGEKRDLLVFYAFVLKKTCWKEQFLKDYIETKIFIYT